MGTEARMITALVFIACGLLVLTACSVVIPTATLSPTPTPSPSPTATPTPTPTLADHVVAAIDRTLSLDLDSYRLRSYANSAVPGSDLDFGYATYDVVLPDRVHWKASVYYLYLRPEMQSIAGTEPDPHCCNRLREPFEPGCEQTTVGATLYERACNGSWRVWELDSSLHIDALYLMGRTLRRISDLSSVFHVDTDTVGDMVLDEYEGQTTDSEGNTLLVSVWIDQDDGIIRRVQVTRRGGSDWWEFYDTNDASISVDPPPCPTIVELPPLREIDYQIPEEGCWKIP